MIEKITALAANSLRKDPTILALQLSHWVLYLHEPRLLSAFCVMLLDRSGRHLVREHVVHAFQKCTEVYRILFSSTHDWRYTLQPRRFEELISCVLIDNDN